MARPTSRRARGQATGAPHQAQSESPPRAEWHWRTFPVAFAFALGALLSGALFALGLGWFAFWISVFGVCFGIAHMITRSLRGYRGR